MHTLPDDIFSFANPKPYLNVLSLLTDGVAVITGGKVIYANPAFCDMSAKNRAALIGCSFLSLVIDADRSMVSDYLRQIDSTGHGTIRFGLQSAAGVVRQVRLKASSIDLHGRYADAPSICCCLTDGIAFQDQIAELRRENRLLHSHLDETEIVLMAFAPYDCDDILMVNRHVEALLGCAKKDIMSGKRHLFDFVHPDYLPQVMDFFNAFPDNHETAEIEYMIIGKDRKTRWVRDMGNTRFVERGGGMPQQIDHILVDITEQKNKELALEQERRKLASILKNSTDMIYRVDKEGNFLDLNPAGKKLLGITDDVSRHNILDFYVERHQRDRLLHQVEAKGHAQQLVKWKVSDNAQIDVVINVVPERNADTGILTYQGIVHNVSQTLELKKVETIKKMAGGLSDRINTPLMTLAMNMKMLRDSLQSDIGDAATHSQLLEEMEKAYWKIVAPMASVREKYWSIKEVSDGFGGTIYEIHEEPRPLDQEPLTVGISDKRLS